MVYPCHHHCCLLGTKIGQKHFQQAYTNHDTNGILYTVYMCNSSATFGLYFDHRMTPASGRDTYTDQGRYGTVPVSGTGTELKIETNVELKSEVDLPSSTLARLSP